MSRIAWRRWFGTYLASGMSLAFLAGSWLAAAPPSSERSTAGQQTTVATKSSRAPATADDLVVEALCAEIDGRTEDRARLLAAARSQSPDSPAVRWNSGEVRHRNAWVGVDQMAALMQKDTVWARYASERENMPDTLEAHLRLGRYCAKRGGLEPQRMAHFLHVLDFDPQNAEARAALGHVRVGSRWMTTPEFKRQQAQAETDAKNWQVWQPRAEAIAKGLGAEGQLRRMTAIDRLNAIDDAGAIAALEAIVSNESEEGALLVVKKLATWTELEASESLARHAVLAPWPNVRKAAALALAPRAEDEYVPLLLGGMYSPIVGSTEIRNVGGGNVVQRQVFAREGQSERQVVGFETSYRRIAEAGGNANDTFARSWMAAQASSQEREQQLAAQNAVTLELNKRIAAALTLATGETLGEDPAKCWQWWNDRNEQFLAGTKPTTTQINISRINMVDRTMGGGFGGGGSTQLPTMNECLAAGTRVWTASGPRPIEEIEIGDMVLSQHPITGELAFKVVQRTTTRPPEKLVKIRAGRELIYCTGGHPFWVAGEGWVKARALRRGFTVHGAESPLTVLSVEPGPEAATYNLIVDDFHSYFVGYDKMLSHDNSLRRPTIVPVPGVIVDFRSAKE